MRLVGRWYRAPQAFSCRWTRKRRYTIGISVLAILALAGCQRTLVLMPTPDGLRTGELDGFSDTPEMERSIVIPIGYATNRLPSENLDRDGYTRAFDDNLRIGIAGVRVGDDPDANWEDLVAISTVADRETEIPLRLHEVEEYLVIPADIDPDNPPEDVKQLLHDLDRHLDEILDPDILIFVHGANNSFYRSVAQAAQYRHFTGRHTAVIAFIWPSMENILRYRTDVENAKRAAPLLANFVDLLATYTDARYINLLGYSLGAVVVSNGLNKLRNDNRDEDPASLRERLRIGEVYYAAADMDFRQFVEQMANYQDIVGRISLTVNMDDSALGFAGFIGGVSRAGRPDPDELSAEETLWLAEASKSPVFDVIEVGEAIRPYEAYKAHDYWYNNPRVSTDVILQMWTHAEPGQRGLLKWQTPAGYEIWYFPVDYQTRAIAAAKAWMEAQARSEEPAAMP